MLNVRPIIDFTVHHGQRRIRFRLGIRSSLGRRGSGCIAFVFSVASYEAGRSMTAASLRRRIWLWKTRYAPASVETDLAMPCLVRSEARLFLARDDGSSTASMGLWTLQLVSPIGAHSLLLKSKGTVVCGVCDQPAHNRRYWATKGGGAFCSQRPALSRNVLRVSAVDELSAQSQLRAASSVAARRAGVPNCRGHR